MSKPNEKAAQQAQTETAAQQASTAAPDSGSAAVVQSASPTPVPPDKHHGTGGLYSVVNGQRVLVDRSQAAADVKAAVQSAT